MLDDIKKALWATADKLRANMDAAEYKHLVFGLIFLKFISDIRQALHLPFACLDRPVGCPSRLTLRGVHAVA
jgi:hypothetical protein